MTPDIKAPAERALRERTPTEECIEYFQREFSKGPDTYTLAAIATAAASAAAVTMSDEEIDMLRRSVNRWFPIALPDGHITDDGPPPTHDMVIEQGRRKRIFDAWRVSPWMIVALLNRLPAPSTTAKGEEGWRLLQPFELLLNQCEAEFTVDGDWSNDGQALTGQTYRACRRNLPLLKTALAAPSPPAEAKRD